MSDEDWFNPPAEGDEPSPKPPEREPSAAPVLPPYPPFESRLAQARTMAEEPVAERRHPEAQSSRLGLAVLVALGVAVLSGVVWALIVRTTDNALQPGAVGIGLLVGVAVRVTGGGRGRDSGALHVVAAFFTVLGITIGKYLTFAFVIAKTVELPAPSPETPPSVFTDGAFSTDTVRLFVEHLGLSFERLDLVWIIAAIGIALLALVPSDTPAQSAAETRNRPPSHNPVDRVTRGLPEPMRVVADWVVTIVGAVAIVLVVKAFVINPYRIPSSSMEPTLHCAQPASGCEARFSDRVLANRFVYHLRDPRRGDIVVFTTPPAALSKCGADGTFVKRLIGLPGETIEVRLSHGLGYVFINGKKLRDPYVEKARRPLESFGPVKIAKDNYFMMGDNRIASCDSRQWGTVPRENLIGKVFATYWPPNRLHLH
jgi:signal peptidase I